MEDRSDAAVVREGFFGDYYEHLAEEDSRAYSAELLISRASNHRDVAQSRLPGNAVVEIAGEADRSVVYIVTDDMPFLVDSVNAELVRQNCAIRLVMHPLFVVTRDRVSGELRKISRVPSNVGISSGDTAALPSVAHLLGDGDNASHMESWIAVEIDRVSDEARGIDRRPAARTWRCQGRSRGLAEDEKQGPRIGRGPGRHIPS